MDIDALLRTFYIRTVGRSALPVGNALGVHYDNNWHKKQVTHFVIESFDQ